MPAPSCRISPARSIRRCETISASFGVSRRMGRKKRLKRMAGPLGSGKGGDSRPAHNTAGSQKTSSRHQPTDAVPHDSIAGRIAKIYADEGPKPDDIVR